MTTPPLIDPYEYTFELYFQYEFLDIKCLNEILHDLDNLYTKILDISHPVYVNQYGPFRNFLEISDINTGNSIKISLKEGWKPEFKIEDGDIDIAVPKKLGIPAILLFFSLSAINQTISIYDKYLDTKIKNVEFQLKELDLYKKIKSVERKQGIRSVNMQATKLARNIVYNTEIRNVEVGSIGISKYIELATTLEEEVLLSQTDSRKEDLKEATKSLEQFDKKNEKTKKLE